MDRTKALEILLTKGWYRNTSGDVTTQLEALNPKWDGFLIDLAQRADIIGGLRVVAMEKLLCGNFAAIAMFSVTNTNGDRYTYEYISWRQGPVSGAKGMVFISDDMGKITHYVDMKSEKFAAGGKISTDAIGGFVEVIDETGINKLLQTFLRECKEELGVTETSISEIIPLGPCALDYGMTNNCPETFAVVMKMPQMGKNTDLLEVTNMITIRPIERLKEDIKSNIDGFTSIIIAKLWANGFLEKI